MNIHCEKPFQKNKEKKRWKIENLWQTNRKWVNFKQFAFDLLFFYVRLTVYWKYHVSCENFHSKPNVHLPRQASTTFRKWKKKNEKKIHNIYLNRLLSNILDYLKCNPKRAFAMFYRFSPNFTLKKRWNYLICLVSPRKSTDKITIQINPP